MGASAREIEREIKETRARLDANLDELEGRAASNAVRYGRLAAIVLGAATIAGIAFLIYRKTRKPTLKERLDALSALPSRLKGELPSVTVKVNEETEREPGIVESIARKVAPSLIGTASAALLDRVGGTQGDEETRAVASRSG